MQVSAGADGANGISMMVLISDCRLAEKWYSRFSTESNKRYSEMGLLSLSVVAYNKSGQLVIDM